MTQRWAFFSHAYNLGDCSRAIEVAKAMRDSGAVVHFFHHGGYHVDAIRDAGLPVTELQPRVTEAQHQFLMDMDQHRAPVGARHGLVSERHGDQLRAPPCAAGETQARHHQQGDAR